MCAQRGPQGNISRCDAVEAKPRFPLTTTPELRPGYGIGHDCGIQKSKNQKAVVSRSLQRHLKAWNMIKPLNIVKPYLFAAILKFRSCTVRTMVHVRLMRMVSAKCKKQYTRSF